MFNRLTSWWTKGKYSHCELIEGYDEDGLAICWSSSFMDGGVRKKHIYLDPEHWDVLDVQVSESVFEDAISWFARHKGERYDVVGLIGFIFDYVSDDNTKWFCSEAIAASLGIREPWRFSPNSLYWVLDRFGGNIQ